MSAQAAMATLDEALLLGRAAPESVNDSGVPAFTRALCKGDEAAWGELHGRYAGRLLRYLLVITRGQEDRAREVLQLTFIRAVRHCRTFESEPALWSWLTRLARSALTDEHRRSSRYLGFLTRWMARPPEFPEADAAEVQLLAVLGREIERLPPADRELLEAKYYGQRRVRDLATQSGATEKSIESRLVRLRRQLKAAVLARLQEDSHE